MKGHTLQHWVAHRLRATDAHGIHSPFVFALYEQVIASKKHYYAFEALEALRGRLLRDSRLVTRTDFGAGGQTRKTKQDTVRAIVRRTSATPKKGRLLFKLAEYFRPGHVLELGTSLGISALYLASGHPPGQFVTLEGCPQLAALAVSHFQEFQLPVTLAEGEIGRQLPGVLAGFPRLDFVYFDANHRMEPTLAYFAQCLPLAAEETVFVFDDIYWSEEMTRAWRQITAHPAVSLSIDLFDFGLVFFRKKQPKQHFKLLF